MRVPASASSGTRPSSGYGVSSSTSMTVPPSPSRRNRCFTGMVWPPGRAHMHPFSRVASSTANQKPVTVRGSVHRNVWSVWLVTSPPMRGCLKMYIDCRIDGSR